MKQIRLYILLSLVLLISSCSNYDEVNTDPDKPASVPSSMLATYVVKKLTYKDGNKSFINDALLAKHIAWNESANEIQYNKLTTSDYENYLTVTNANDMLSKAPETKVKGYEGLALFAKAQIGYYISLNLGDVPYSEAAQGESGITKPKYDTQKDIMIAVLNDLDKAYACFSAAETTAFDGDIIFDGNKEAWKKTVRAFQLKVLINLSKKESDTDLNVKAKFAQLVNDGSLMTSNADNFQLTYADEAGMRYPFNHLETNQVKYFMLSTVMTDLLKEYEDYRLFYFAEPAQAKTEAGVASDDYDAYPGIDPSIAYAEIKELVGINMYCLPNDRYTDKARTIGEPMIRLGYAEQQFILAEACLRGWISGTPANYYKEAIKAHMTFVRDVTPETYAHNRVMTDAYITSYLANPKIQLTGSFEKDLELVMTQKYISYYMQWAYEAYYDYRRTGYPKLPISSSTSMNSTAPDKIPTRYRYSSREYNYNKANLDEALARQFNGSDDNNDLMWILK